MKILFFISLQSHGRGGHVHSLNHISQRIGTLHTIKIVSIGPGKSDILQSNHFFLKHLPFKGINLWQFRKRIKRIKSKFSPDIIHCFDVNSYNIIRLIFSTKSNKIILNKCGGPNPRSFPHIPNLILFSKENHEWFTSKSKYDTSTIHLIPNRVKSLNVKLTLITPVKVDNEFVFIRICRIVHTYEKSIKDSIRLIEYLTARKNANVKLIIIGVVQDHQLYYHLSNIDLVKKDKVHFITAPIYTSEASKMLYLADAVIGTGRGLMEAASLGIPVLAIDKEGNMPVLLNEENFEDAFKTNFSERNIFKNDKKIHNLSNIQKLITDKAYRHALSSFSSEIFDKYFNIDKVVDAYTHAYKQTTYGKRNLLVDSKFILESMFTFYRNSIDSRNKR